MTATVTVGPVAAPLDRGLLWPQSRLVEALSAVAGRLGRPQANAALEASRPPRPADREVLDRFVGDALARAQIEAEPVEVALQDVDRLLADRGAAILRIRPGDESPLGDESSFLLLIPRRGSRWGSGLWRGGRSVLTPDHRLVTLPVRRLADWLKESATADLRRSVEPALERAGLSAERRRQAAAVLARDAGSTRAAADGWLLRLPPSARFVEQLREARLDRHLAGFLLAQVALVGFFVAGWWLLGRGALTGRFEAGWLVAWVLCVATLAPLAAARSWFQGRLTFGLGAVLKRRLLHGALRMDAEILRREGSGHLLGRVIESESLASLGLGSAFFAAIAVVELAFAGWLVASASVARWLLPLFVAMLVATLVLGLWLFRIRRRWVGERIRMTHELVERMEGHQTRLAQESPGRWHVEEDARLAGYLRASRDLDRVRTLLLVWPRLWLVVGLAALLPAFVAAEDVVGLAVALGGVLLTLQALASLAGGLDQVTAALVSWRQVQPIFDAARGSEALGSVDVVAAASSADLDADSNAEPNEEATESRTDRGSVPLVECSEMDFRHAGRERSVLRGVDLTIDDGDKILLTGPSGCGKSTLASILVGLRTPTSGLLLARGLDRGSLGDRGWRRMVSAAPQFHENHVFADTFLFNLLMGRRWPPGRDDIRAARRVCTELGLDELVQRMPAGLQQAVGDSGWQLSHGERSRLFMARALLQQSRLIVLDESLAALDPENLARALSVALDHDGAFLLIAHP